MCADLTTETATYVSIWRRENQTIVRPQTLWFFSEYTQEASCSRHHWEASWEHREASTSRDISEASLRPLELSGRHLEASRGICEASGDTRLHVKDNNLGMREPSGGIWGHPAIFGNISRHLSLSRSLEAGQGI